MKIQKYEKYTVEPNCEYCKNGGLEKRCEQRAIEKKKYACRKFSYDPLKRIPSKIIVPKEVSPEDFKIG